jgi:DNA-binding response OmpR family regulator
MALNTMSWTSVRPRALPRILIVEGNAGLARLLRDHLDRAGYGAAIVDTAADMRSVLARSTPDLVILDSVLPDEDGWSALRWIRARRDVPVLLLIAEGTEIIDDKLSGSGADDYLVKPFSGRELLARLGAMRQNVERLPEVIEFAGWVLDLATQQLTMSGGKSAHLTQAEYRILELLARNPLRTVTRDQLMTATAGREWQPFDRSIDVHVSNLRRKLDPEHREPSLIRTVRGAGYMFVPGRAAASA